MRRLFGKNRRTGRNLAAFFYNATLAVSPVDLQKTPQHDPKTNRLRLFKIAAFLSIVLFFIAVPAFAATDTLDAVANYIIAIGTSLLITVAELMGNVLLFLVQFLIDVTQYNNFVKASPVVVGWPLIRDTVNMFFIVVVLVSAFSTIIGYPQEFRYNNILPKLLLMAVLINFSKTLIGLLIDFSQVITLTFVNGFKQAAGGNFVTAFQIDKIMQMDATTDTITMDGNKIVVNWSEAKQERPFDMLEIFMAAFLGMWVLSIAITIIVIMLIFFVARVIMIWFLLITSPMMFFAWALPEKLKKGFAPFTDEWWKRLTGALIGGPLMAFFLWLSLAMAQKSTDITGAQGLFKNSNTSEMTAMQNRNPKLVSTQIGKPDALATFIIMVAFMLIGVKTAVEQGSTLGGPASKLISGLGSAGGAMGLGAYATMLAARKTASAAKTGAGLAYKGAALAGKGALYSAKMVDKRFDMSGAMASGILKDSTARKLLPFAAQAGLAKVAGARAKRVKEKEKDITGALADMPDEVTKHDMLVERASGSLIGGSEDKIAAHLALVKQTGNGKYIKDVHERRKKELMTATGRPESDFNEEQKEQFANQAKAEVTRERAKILENAEKVATNSNNKDLMEAVKEAREKNSALVSVDKRAAAMRIIATNDEAEKKLDVDSFQDAMSIANYYKEKKWINADGSVSVMAQFDPEYQKEKRGRRGQLMSAFESTIQNNPDMKRNAAILIDPLSNVGALQAANFQVESSKDNESYIVVDSTGAVRRQQFSGVTSSPAEIMSNVSTPAIATRLTTALTADGLGVADVGIRLDDRKADRVAKALTDMHAGSISTEQAQNIMLEENVNINLLGSVATAGGVGRELHRDSMTQAVTTTNARAFANGLNQARVLAADRGDLAALSAQAESLSAFNATDFVGIIQATRGDADATFKARQGLQQMIIEADKIAAAGGPGGDTVKVAIADFAKKLKKGDTATGTTKDWATINKFIFKGHE